MAVCTFFGHRDCPPGVKPHLQAALSCLITECGVDTFYVGDKGKFDRMVYSLLREFRQLHPQCTVTVVLAYLPSKEDRFYDAADTMLPEGIERVPKRAAIVWRNEWMLNRANYVVTYITHDWGGAAQFAKAAQQRGKKIVSLAQMSSIPPK